MYVLDEFVVLDEVYSLHSYSYLKNQIAHQSSYTLS